MKETLVIDYSFARPSLHAIKRSGYVAIMRYLAPLPNAKVATRAEVEEIHKRRFPYGLVWESTSTRATSGADAGKEDREAAEAQAKALGYRGKCAIQYAVDEEVPWSAVAPYFGGIADRGGEYPWGPYGSDEIITQCGRAFNHDVGWQCAAWSSGELSAYADLYQRVGHRAPLVPGGGYDEDVVCRPILFDGPNGVVELRPGGAEPSKPTPAPRPKKDGSTPLAKDTEQALDVIIRNMRKRTHPIAADERDVALRAQRVITRALSIKGSK